MEEREAEAEVDVKHSTAFLNYAKGAGACVTALVAAVAFCLSLKSQCSPEEPKAQATAKAAAVTLEQVSADVQKEHDAREQLAKALAADIKQVQGDVKSVLMLLSQHLSSHTVRPAAKKDDTAVKLIKKIDKRESTQVQQLSMPRPPLRKMKME